MQGADDTKQRAMPPEAAVLTLLTLPSRIGAVEEAAAAVAALLRRSGTAEHITQGIELAVREAVANAVLHGNKQDVAKTVRVTVRATPDQLEVTVHDEGVGFEPAAIPDPTATDNLLKISGRGVSFMRHFMDQVAWVIRPEGGTTVRMTKKY